MKGFTKNLLGLLEVDSPPDSSLCSHTKSVLDWIDIGLGGKDLLRYSKNSESRETILFPVILVNTSQQYTKSTLLKIFRMCNGSRVVGEFYGALYILFVPDFLARHRMDLGVTLNPQVDLNV